MKRLVAVATLLGLGGPAAAQSITVSGARLSVQAGTTVSVSDSLLNRTGSQLSNSGTLHLGRTLNNAGSFTSDGLLRFSGTAKQRLVSGGATVAQLEVDNTASAGQNQLVVTDDLAITQRLLLTNGLVRTPGTKIISLLNGATLEGEAAGRYVVGNVRITRSAVAGPVDFGHGAWLDASGQNLGDVTITRTAGLRAAGVSYGTNLGATTKGIDRIWTITAAQAPTAAVPLRLSWPAADDNGLTDFAQAQAWRQGTPAAAWELVGARSNANSRSISTSTAAFGRFTVSNAANPLPVELISFTAERRGPDAWLRWATASEKNSSYFVVESSPDARTFRAVGQVSSRGTTTRRTEYQFTDANLGRYAATTVYYRLRQVDADGAESYSPVQAVSVPLEAALAVQAWPNPFRNEAVTMLISTPHTGPATIELADAVGRVLWRQPTNLGKGSNTISLPRTAQLPEGVYLVRVQQAAELRVLKLVCQ
ncbi:T9SS type A sorting domain-containing protein [Solirubrum puertoriconensis]|uniref:Secretion system C-terminal sorting domain-containing protein n=1 Tax=Solirubrum puertoriconensis TaxID=1751427 RepID=A0A9X0HIZ4_SOLP1|nr:T9SS type A sorting domain-containing protein [Solirubrum puertoriconensis]KUG06716.1 hypothetical protein ASU33_05100 [Solirubrum puertoriconensis]